MKKFETPQIEVCIFNAEDVLTASGGAWEDELPRDVALGFAWEDELPY